MKRARASHVVTLPPTPFRAGSVTRDWASMVRLSFGETTLYLADGELAARLWRDLRIGSGEQVSVDRIDRWAFGHRRLLPQKLLEELTVGWRARGEY